VIIQSACGSSWMHALIAAVRPILDSGQRFIAVRSASGSGSFSAWNEALRQGSRSLDHERTPIFDAFHP
jgi:hypothetical protein